MYALSEMRVRMFLLREFRPPCMDLSPGAVGLEACETGTNHRKKKDLGAEKYLGGNLLGVQQLLVRWDLDNVNWPHWFGESCG